MSSVGGSIEIQASLPFNGTPYNISKSSLNTIASRLAFEEKDKLIVLIVHPGTIDTEMVNHLIESNIDVGPIQSVQEGTQNIVKLLDEATHEDSGRFIDASTGTTLPW